MSRRQVVLCAWLALLVLPGCFDAIVGSECKPGFSPCHGVCVVAGTCSAIDGGGEAGPIADGADIDGGVGEGGDGGGVDGGDNGIDGGLAPGLDGGLGGEAGSGLDGGAEDHPEGDGQGGVGEGGLPSGLDGAPDGAGGGQATDAGTDDGPADGPADVPLTDDGDAAVGTTDKDAAPILAGDATVDQGGDGESEAGTADGGGSPPGLGLDGASADGDAEGTGTTDDAGTGDAAGDDALADSPAADAAPLVCTDPLIPCDQQCVDPSADPENCGGCNTICVTGVCNNGRCLVCGPDQSVCGRQCINTATDPDNCGGCGVPCSSGLCSNGRCEAAGTGRTIVIGHDYLHNRPAMNRILGNAVFLWPVNPVRLLVYEGAANPGAIAGADAAIAQVSASTGRQSIRTAVAAADVPTALTTTDVFLVYAQELASDGVLIQLGQDWKAAITTFVQNGGTMIVLDAVFAANAGTSQILAQAGLFDVARGTAATGDVCTVIARGDALATGLPRTYLCEMDSTSVVVNDTATTVTAVVADGARTVVVHKVF